MSEGQISEVFEDFGNLSSLPRPNILLDPLARSLTSHPLPETRMNLASDVRYLILQRGSARLQVLEIRPGQRITIGRTPRNSLVVPDRKCSRVHCEVFCGNGTWYVRDNQSRNGVFVEGAKIEGDTVIQTGQTIAVGDFSIQMTSLHPEQVPPDGTGNSLTPATDDQDGFEIIERKSMTQYDNAHGLHATRVGPLGAADLFKLSQSMQTADDIEALAGITLDGLLKVIPASMAALLLLPDDDEITDPQHLKVMAMRVPEDQPKELRFSSHLSEQVFRSREAVLAHDVSQCTALARSESLEMLAAESVVCAPIRLDGCPIGVIHLYSTSVTDPLDSRHLEYTLAVADHMAGLVRKTRDRQKLAQNLVISEQRSKEYQAQLGLESELIGKSAAVQKLKQAIGRVARSDATVLIRGESGVGKELVARAVHFNSPRRDGPIICVNCAALTETLLESELFGHEKGAFTGAMARRIGKFEEADGGTLLLDEISEMDVRLQAKLLRAIQERVIDRVGGTRPVPVNIRIIATSNRDLGRAVSEGTFREDLLYRLNVVNLRLPALRERPGDIAVLASHFVKKYAAANGVPARPISADAHRALVSHRWNGNVRELENAMHRAVLLAVGPEIDVDAIRLPDGQPLSAGSHGAAAYDSPAARAAQTADAVTRAHVGQTVAQMEKTLILDTLSHCLGNRTHAATILGISIRTLRNKLNEYADEGTRIIAPQSGVAAVGYAAA